MPELVPNDNINWGPAADTINRNFNELAVRRRVKTVYTLNAPASETVYDTGYAPVNDGVKDIALGVVVDVDGTSYGLFSTVRVETIAEFPDVRLAMDSAFLTITGSVEGEVWLDSATGTIKYMLRVNGAGKTIVTALLRETQYSIHTFRARYYLRPNGFSQDITLNTPYTTQAGEPISMKFKGGDVLNFYATFFSTDFATVGVTADVSKTKFLLIGCTALLDGVPITSGTTDIPATGDHSLTIYPTASEVCTKLLAGPSGNRLNLIVYDVVMGDGSVHNYPIDDGSLTQVANRGTGEDATPNAVTLQDWYLDDYV